MADDAFAQLAERRGLGRTGKERMDIVGLVEHVPALLELPAPGKGRAVAQESPATRAAVRTRRAGRISGGDIRAPPVHRACTAAVQREGLPGRRWAREQRQASTPRRTRIGGRGRTGDATGVA